MEASSDLERLSCLCRKLHNEALNQSKVWTLRSSARSPSPTSFFDDFRENEDFEAAAESNNTQVTDRKSNSTEDLSNLLNGKEDINFTRDCKVRRSLQIGNVDTIDDNNCGAVGRVRIRPRNDFIAERARKFEENEDASEVKKNFISTKSFTPIANNDFIKNDPNHPSKFNQFVSKLSPQDNRELHYLYIYIYFFHYTLHI